MHFKDCFFKQDRCLICFKRTQDNFLYAHLYHSPICFHCYQQLNVIFKFSTFMGYKILYMYEYNDFFRKILYQYKGQNDIELANVFFSVYIQKIRRMYHDYIVVVVPSSNIQNDIRGFAPMYEIAKTLGLPIFLGLYKSKDYKQSDQAYSNRVNINEIIHITNIDEIKGRKVLIIDDVMTSGNTMKRCISLVEKANPKTIQLLVLSISKKHKNFVD